MRVKNVEQRRAAYRSGTAVAPERYKQGVAAVGNWKEAAINGQKLYEEQMRNAAVLARREKGLNKVSNETWKGAAMNQGAARIGQGMAAAVDKQVANSQPYMDALAAMELPDRTTDPDTNIDNRVKPIARKLREIKNSL